MKIWDVCKFAIAARNACILWNHCIGVKCVCRWIICKGRLCLNIHSCCNSRSLSFIRTHRLTSTWYNSKFLQVKIVRYIVEINTQTVAHIHNFDPSHPHPHPPIFERPPQNTLAQLFQSQYAYIPCVFWKLYTDDGCYGNIPCMLDWILSTERFLRLNVVQIGKCE